MLGLSQPTVRLPYQADWLVLFLDTSMGIAGAGLDSSGVRPIDSHLSILTSPTQMGGGLRRALGAEQTTRNPWLLFLLSGLFLLR
jgi:hypothetical protein